MSVRDFIVFCETVCGRPLTAQQRALAEALLANPHGLSLLRTARQGSRSFIQKLHERFMQGRRADLLIVDNVASSTEAAKLPIEMSNEAEHSPPKQPKPRTQPCYVCNGFGSRASDDAPDPRRLCLDCKVDTIDRTRPWDYYMVHNDLWQVAGVGTDMLCLGCFAQRLGRPLEASDFTPAPINRINPLVAALCRAADAGPDAKTP